ncbi:MAG TPA: hypothetical protein VK662_08425 [Acidothermaceae bacterium]|nr:hypothetical protein [Acidothermaceae bacterium]
MEAAVLTQGVSFLYDQAGQLLKRRRARRDRVNEGVGREGDASGEPEMKLPRLTPPEGIFVAGNAGALDASSAALDQLAEDLLHARRNVECYVMGESALDVGSDSLVVAIETLRRVLEEIYGANLTFSQERRKPATVTTTVSSQGSVGGITVGGSLNVTGDFAMRDIHKATRDA